MASPLVLSRTETSAAVAPADWVVWALIRTETVEFGRTKARYAPLALVTVVATVAPAPSTISTTAPRIGLALPAP